MTCAENLRSQLMRVVCEHGGPHNVPLLPIVRMVHVTLEDVGVANVRFAMMQAAVTESADLADASKYAGITLTAWGLN
jgi:hypothetical protein